MENPCGLNPSPGTSNIELVKSHEKCFLGTLPDVFSSHMVCCIRMNQRSRIPLPMHVSGYGLPQLFIGSEGTLGLEGTGTAGCYPDFQRWSISLHLSDSFGRSNHILDFHGNSGHFYWNTFPISHNQQIPSIGLCVSEAPRCARCDHQVDDLMSTSSQSRQHCLLRLLELRTRAFGNDHGLSLRKCRGLKIRMCTIYIYIFIYLHIYTYIYIYVYLIYIYIFTMVCI